jgi:hypothetical protein
MLAVGEYHDVVKRLIPASVAGFALAAGILLAGSTAQAQVNGTPPSVTSIGFGGHFDKPQGVPPSVTSLGPQGYTPHHQVFPQAFCCYKGSVAPANAPIQFNHHPHRDAVSPVGGAVYAVPYPVYVTDTGAEDPGPALQPENYPAGPTIFDRRASEQSSAVAEAAYAERLRDERSHARDEDRVSMPAPPTTPVAAGPTAELPQTVLVFKDGHQLEVQNYAIVGAMLFDLTPGHHGKIAISDLDLAATAKQNDDRGIDFRLPTEPESN